MQTEMIETEESSLLMMVVDGIRKGHNYVT